MSGTVAQGTTGDSPAAVDVCAPLRAAASNSLQGRSPRLHPDHGAGRAALRRLSSVPDHARRTAGVASLARPVGDPVADRVHEHSAASTSFFTNFHPRQTNFLLYSIMYYYSRIPFEYILSSSAIILSYFAVFYLFKSK